MDVLTAKGDGVVSVRPDCDVAGLLTVLAEHGIGASVVSSDGAVVEGIVSERDVVRRWRSGSQRSSRTLCVRLR